MVLKKIGCIHAHYSNIDYLEKAFLTSDIEFLHFVDPGLMHCLQAGNSLSREEAQEKVREQIAWVAKCQVDAILISCTNYIALLEEAVLPTTVPIIKIDEPFFESICQIQEPQTIVFSNPATVEGTMSRLYQYASAQQKLIDLEVVVVENSFNLIMNGLKEEYNQKVVDCLEQLKEKNRVISVAQLSMVEAAKQVEDRASIGIINPLKTLKTLINNDLNKSFI
ncbi:hypothetical protein [Bacillus sp. AFS040349]|uniref:hypothetical protein n=1 Tax=Bacillus sp. AFS040349 TaxID=2033502 RepID=UPI000BFE3646|nr:hypothetical protein [Bacillus sp. AFS040349]PGT82772.1 hypothetical protein COD11_14220 [Bacillus sp. AFS040349]